MPVLVTNADTPLGVSVVTHLLALGGEVRAYCSAGGGVMSLRAAGAIAASGDLDDEGRLEAACEQVHTVVHLGGGLLSRSADQIVAQAATLATATGNAGVRRVVALSVVGASTTAPDALRRAKAVEEQVLASSSPPSIVLRVPLVETEGLRGVLAGTPLPPTVADAAVRTVRPEDVVALVVALDEMRSHADAGHALLVAQGGPAQPLANWLDTHRDRRGTYLPPDRAPLLLEGLAGAWTDDDPVATDAWEFTGVDRASI